MKLKNVLAASLVAEFITGAALGANTNCYDFPGANGDYAHETTEINGGEGFRTGTGFPAWTAFGIINVDTLDPAQNGLIWVPKRSDNDQYSHEVHFDPNNNTLEYSYAGSDVFSLSNNTFANTTDWYVWSLRYEGDGGNIVMALFDLATATLIDDSSGAPGGSVFSDSFMQVVNLGGVEVGGTVTSELDGQSCLPGMIIGDYKTTEELEAWAENPLAIGDQWVDEHGADIYWWDDSGMDQGGNAVGTLTLVGGVTLGTGNGPNIPARSAGGALIMSRFREGRF